MVYWCNNCGIPIFGSRVCPLCDNACRPITGSSVCNPVFAKEKMLVSYILNSDYRNANLWYLGGAKYILDGKVTKLPFVSFFKSKEHLKVADSLRNYSVTSDAIIYKEKFISANTRYINDIIFEAEGYVIEQAKELTRDDYLPTISFSGGKDSTVISRLVRDALQTDSIIHYFGDTTLEFPTTYEYLNVYFRKENPIPPIFPSETDNDFFKLCKVLGPPSRFERWCCTIFKTSNLNTEFQDLAGKSLTFLGIRRSESNERKDYIRTQRDSKISTQINAMPIIEWTDYDVWLYILYKGLQFNDAYRYGYKRVGCWCCPYNSDWATMLTDIYFPDLASLWKDTLYDFAHKTNKTDIADYVENGKWKTRKGASGLEIKNINIEDTPCNLSNTARNIIIKKKIGRDALEFFKPLGKLKILDKEDATYITIDKEDNDKETRKVCDLIINFGTSVIKVLPGKGVDSLLLVNRIKCQLRKYQFCIRCSACDSTCPNGAIDTIRYRYKIDESKCNSCSKCIAHFYNGCITCKVLAGKKYANKDRLDNEL